MSQVGLADHRSRSRQISTGASEGKSNSGPPRTRRDVEQRQRSAKQSFKQSFIVFFHNLFIIFSYLFFSYSILKRHIVVAWLWLSGFCFFLSMWKLWEQPNEEHGAWSTWLFNCLESLPRLCSWKGSSSALHVSWRPQILEKRRSEAVQRHSKDIPRVHPIFAALIIK